MTEEFEHLAGWDLLVESRQYRGAGGKSLNLRNVADFAFLDLLAVYILSNEYESAHVASNYADKTMSYRGFARGRLSGTDLYTSFNILANPDSVFSKQIKQNPDADAILRTKINVHLPTLRRYLDLLADNKMRMEDAQVLLLRLEKQLNITDSKLKSIRRLAQQWPALNGMQRELVVTRMLQYYKRNTKRSELAEFLTDMGKHKGYVTKGGIDAELANLGMGSTGKKGWGALAALGTAAAGYQAGKWLAGGKGLNKDAETLRSTSKEMGKWLGK